MSAPERVESPLRRSSRIPSTASTVSTEPVAPVRDERALPLRELTGWEEEYLERHQQDGNTARLCNEVLARCLVPPGADPGAARERVRGLLVAERDRELVRLRRLSLGADVNAQVDCPECGTANEARFSLDTLTLDFDVPARELEVDLPGVGLVGLRLPTAGDQEDLLDLDDAIDTQAARRSWVLARCIRRFPDRAGGPDLDRLDLDGVRALPVAQRSALEAAIDARLPHLDLEMALECAHCRAGFIAPFDVAIFFFRIETARAAGPARRPPARAGLSLGRARHPRPAPGAPARLPVTARGGRRRRPAARRHRRRSLVNDSLVNKAVGC